MPPHEEFVRAYVAEVPENSIGLSLWPMRCFRLLSSDFLNISEPLLKESVLRFADQGFDYVSQVVNHRLNEQLLELHKAGRVEMLPDTHAISSEQYLLQYGSPFRLITDDGYMIFYPGNLPPSPVATYQ